MASTSLRDCDARLRDLYIGVKLHYEETHPGHTIRETCTFRTPEEQQELYAKGRTTPGAIVTQIDGVAKLSNHNVYPSRAIDFVVLIHGKVSWDFAEYAVVGQIAESVGLIWGGAWATFRDGPHLELPEET